MGFGAGDIFCFAQNTFKLIERDLKISGLDCIYHVHIGCHWQSNACNKPVYKQIHTKDGTNTPSKLSSRFDKMFNQTHTAGF